MDPKDPLGITNLRSMVLANAFMTLLLLGPILLGTHLPLGLWLGYAWGIVVGSLLGWRILRTPHPRQRLKEGVHGAGAALQRSVVIGIVVGGSGLAYSVMLWWFGENLTLFLLSGGLATLVIAGWMQVIACWRDRSE